MGIVIEPILDIYHPNEQAIFRELWHLHTIKILVEKCIELLVLVFIDYKNTFDIITKPALIAETTIATPQEHECFIRPL